jgi:hypothetical protein
VAEWLRSGLQSRLHRFDSGRRLVAAAPVPERLRPLCAAIAAGADHRRMHASIWKFGGDPDRLLEAYEALIAETPSNVLRLHLCMRSPDGIVFVDTCPSREAWEAFAADPGFREQLERHGLGRPTSVEDFPVHVAFVNGEAQRPAAPVASS